MEHKGTASLETERLILRRFCASDAQAAYKNWTCDARVTRFMTWSPHESADITRKWIESSLERYNDPSYYHWAIVLKKTNEPIGSVSVVRLNDTAGCAEVGYCIGYDYWHKGYTSEALLAVEDFLFIDVGLNSVRAQHDVNNPHSGGVMNKCGMRFEGVLRRTGRSNSGICDLANYSITREEYLEAKAHGGVLRSEYNCGFSTGSKWFRLRAAGIIVEEGRVLFITNKLEDYLYSVGGAIHMGETAEDAVRREVFEETGEEYEIDRLAVIHENFFYETGGVLAGLDCHEVCFYFLMKPKGRVFYGKAGFNSFGEREDLVWLTPAELENKRAYPEFMARWLREMPEGIVHIVSDERISE